jgi:excinuclease ABC subunit C
LKKQETDSGQIREILSSLPNKPGVYQYLDDTGTIIYVGKAKDLRKRVSSYFQKDQGLSGKVRVMVKKIRDIQTIVVDSELDALLLENNLIKKYQPRYNIMLKDDKTFPWICIRKEAFPRVFPTRNVVRDGSEYYGPYASVKLMNTLLELIRQLYPLRNCSLPLSRMNIEKGKFKVCLEYHIGNCLGPCENRQSEEEYSQTLDQIRHIIKGNISTVQQILRKLMLDYASEFAFEKAQVVKQKLEVLEKFQAKSTIVNPKIDHVDVLSLIDAGDEAYVNYFKVIQGAIVQSHTVELRKKLDELPAELLAFAILELRDRYSSTAPEVIVPIDPGISLEGVVFTIPQRGDKKQLLELSERNARHYQLEKQKRQELVDPERHSKRILARMKADLRLLEEPHYIECFDNSNIQGSNPVAAMVVFRNGKPSKKEYRHFNIKTVEGPDDFASMAEIVHRRYARLLKDGSELPQLILIDGGKGQLSAALGSLEALGLRGKIGIIGIAKRLEELYYPGDSLPLYLDKKSETLRVLQHARDEAHRFGITFHRSKREKSMSKSVLTEIEGIGYRTTQELIWKFKSVARVKKASLEELTAVIGKARAKVVFDHFREAEAKAPSPSGKS